MRSWPTLLLFSITCFAPAMGRPDSAEPSKCQQPRWSQPRLLAGDSSRAPTARFPSIAGDARAVYVIGHNVGGRPVARAVGDPVTIQLLDGGTLPLPAGPYTFGFPKAAVDDHGRLHVLWGEPAEDALGAGVVQSVWVATYDAESGTWSEPRRLFHGLLAWSSKSTDEIASGDGRLALSAAWASSAFFLFDGVSWRVRSTVEPDVGSVSSTAIRDSCLYTAYIQGIPGNPNSVSLRKSCDWGATWSNQLLAASNGKPAMEVRARFSNDGALHVIWSQALSERQVVLRHVESRDQGRTWSRVEEMALPEGLAVEFVAAADRCARVHVVAHHVVEADRDPLPLLLHIVWDGRWLSPVEPFKGVVQFDPALWSSADGGVLLVATFRPIGAPTTDDNYATYVSDLQP